METLLRKWMEIKNVEKAMKEQREDIEAQIYLLIRGDLPEDGSKSFNLEGYKLTVKQNVSVSVNQELAARRPELFKIKFDMSYSQYKKSNEKLFLDDVITYKTAKPTFTVVKGEE